MVLLNKERTDRSHNIISISRVFFQSVITRIMKRGHFIVLIIRNNLYSLYYRSKLKITKKNQMFNTCCRILMYDAFSLSGWSYCKSVHEDNKLSGYGLFLAIWVRQTSINIYVQYEKKHIDCKILCIVSL